MSRNLKLFILFRTLYHSRFYYPVFSILFFDFGLSVKDFAFLNMIWAITIALFEIPSGALADRFGRKPLVITSALLMVIEMTILVVAPIGGQNVFWFFLINRIASGLSEACASGADEALAYDSIPEEKRKEQWATFFPTAMRWVSFGFLIFPVIGAISYDNDFINTSLVKYGINFQFSAEASIKSPLVLTLLTAVGALITSLFFVETHSKSTNKVPLIQSMLTSGRNTLSAGSWILRHRLVMGVILFGLVTEGFIRLFYSYASNYYRLIGLEERYFGLLGATGTIIGIGCTYLMTPMEKKLSRITNYSIITSMCLFGLISMAIAIKSWLGFILLIPLLLSMRFLAFFTSHDINAETSSERRATVLSFRGFAYNIGYGALLLLYGLLWNSDQDDKTSIDMPNFEKSLDWWPWAYLELILVGCAYFFLTKKRTH